MFGAFGFMVNDNSKPDAPGRFLKGRTAFAVFQKLEFRLHPGSLLLAAIRRLFCCSHAELLFSCCCLSCPQWLLVGRTVHQALKQPIHVFKKIVECWRADFQEQVWSEKELSIDRKEPCRYAWCRKTHAAVHGKVERICRPSSMPHDRIARGRL